MTHIALFDFDGTLTDSTTWFHDTVNEAARRHRFRVLNADEREMLRHLTSREILRYCGVPTWKLPAITRTIQAAMARDIDLFTPFDYVPALFDKLTAEGIRIGVVSSNNIRNIRQILGPELSARIDHFETGAAMFGKARRFRRAMKALQATRAVVVGDEERDILAAQKAGLPILSVTWGFATPDRLKKAKATAIIDDPAKLGDAIKKALGL